MRWLGLGDHPYRWLWHRDLLHVNLHISLVCYHANSLDSAKILAHIVLDDLHIRSYADIGRKVFGSRSVPVISLLFGLELFTVSYAHLLYTMARWHELTVLVVSRSLPSMEIPFTL